MKKEIHKFLNLLLPSNCRSHDFEASVTHPQVQYTRLPMSGEQVFPLKDGRCQPELMLLCRTGSMLSDIYIYIKPQGKHYAQKLQDGCHTALGIHLLPEAHIREKSELC